MTLNPKPTVEVHDISKRKGVLKNIGGSMSDNWNNILANQTIQTLWLKVWKPTKSSTGATPQ
jgi:hypothetical protein